MNALFLDRRSVLRASLAAGGSLVLGYAPATSAQNGAAVHDFNPFIRIAPDDTITLTVHKPENGQGAVTTLCMLLTEELDCDWERLQWEFAPVARVYGFPLQGTFGSLGVRSSWQPLREAGAKTRVMLQSAAASRWGVAVAQTHTGKGRVYNTASGASFSYGELAGEAALLPVPDTVALKPPAQYRLIGKPTPRRDTLDKITGKARYGIDVRVPGMAFAVLERSPVFGGKVVAFDDARTRAFPGVLDVVQVSRGVAVVASNTWAAMEGRKRLDVVWDEGPGAALSSAAIRRMQQEALAGSGTVSHSEGDVERLLDTAAQRLTAEYEVPYLAHTTMEPPNTTARLEGEDCEVWSGSQIPGLCHLNSVAASGLKPEQVVVNTLYIGGGFGSRGGGNVYTEAVEVAMAAGRPVNLLYTREDDIQQDRYRPCAMVRLEAALDADGWPVALKGHACCQHFQDLQNGLDREALAGLEDNDYALAAQHFAYTPLELDVPTNFWRSVGASQNVYFMEAFLDELAAAGGKDPVALRRRLLAGKPRLRHVLELAAERAGWGTPAPEGRYRGVACVSCFGSHIAQVAEISLKDGKVRVHRVTCVVDCGQVVNPLTVVQQMQGGIVYGLTAVLRGEITLENGRVQQSNFHDYDALRMDEMPFIDVHIVASDDPAPGGIGETGTPAIAPAVVNAVFAATGTPVRRLPLESSRYAFAVKNA
ncbi:MAG TPA: xanthine dehydrogenase family protein molybdopterin-binding subunit [Hyphomicrobiales bacterium]|nr:xanthine dehydrogenase family protein molybdopterin-binding subunit [Hyphomicrobiales bacterium]